jgi:hypothetical protein
MCPIETIIEENPFVRLGLADFRVIEFRASQRRMTSRSVSSR